MSSVPFTIEGLTEPTSKAMNCKPVFPLVVLFLIALVLARPTEAQDIPPNEDAIRRALPEKSYSPYADRSYATNVYWGDTHLHTSFSFDAGSFGNRLGPEKAYQFARAKRLCHQRDKRSDCSVHSTS